MMRERRDADKSGVVIPSFMSYHAGQVSRLYGILAVLGWVWLGMVLLFVLWKLKRRPSDEPRGFDAGKKP